MCAGKVKRWQRKICCIKCSQFGRERPEVSACDLEADASPQQLDLGSGPFDLVSNDPASATPKFTAHVPKQVRFCSPHDNLNEGSEGSPTDVRFGFGRANWRRRRVGELVGLAVLAVSSVIITVVAHATGIEDGGRRRRRLRNSA